jgi:flagellar biosynthesis regulator FlbT
LIEPFATGSECNQSQLSANCTKMSEINIDNKHLEELVESVVFESLEAIRKQVKVKQWQQILNDHDRVEESS